MIIVLRPDATDEQIDHVLERIGELGFKPHISKGSARTIIGVIGDETKLEATPLSAIPGVEQVLPILKAFKLASREMQRQDSVVEVRAGKSDHVVKIGGGHLAMIAGPCAIESAEVLETIAGKVKAAGANILRGGAFKPRTSPYAFQGLGEAGLKILEEVGHRHGLPVVTEVMDPRQVEVVNEHADMFQIGARNMQNFDLLKEVGRAGKPVLLKRGLSATVKDLLMSAEYVLSEGNLNVVLCERGVKSFEDSTRNMLDLSSVPNVKGQSHLPIIVDPSHATGRPDLIPSMAKAAIAAGADGGSHRGPQLSGEGTVGWAAGAAAGPVRGGVCGHAAAGGAAGTTDRIIGNCLAASLWRARAAAALARGSRLNRGVPIMRNIYVVGNWKMNTTPSSAIELASAVAAGVDAAAPVEVVVCPPFPFLAMVGQVLRGKTVKLGGQNCYHENEGAFNRRG